MSITRFEDIDAWKVARVLAEKVALATSARRFHRHPDLRAQMRRAASSVMANIAEGFNSGTDAEFARFLRIALRSATELQSHLYCALDRSLLTASEFDLVYGVAADVKNLIGGFVKYLSNRKRPAHLQPMGLRTKD
jgi:four helix bundle protein